MPPDPPTVPVPIKKKAFYPNFFVLYCFTSFGGYLVGLGRCFFAEAWTEDVCASRNISIRSSPPRLAKKRKKHRRVFTHEIFVVSCLNHLKSTYFSRWKTPKKTRKPCSAALCAPHVASEGLHIFRFRRVRNPLQPTDAMGHFSRLA